MSSFSPVTMTVCGVCQLRSVKVRVAWSTVTSVVSRLVTSITTSPFGALLSTTVKVSVVVGVSEVVSPLVGATVKPKVPVSSTVMETSAGSAESYPELSVVLPVLVVS